MLKQRAVKIAVDILIKILRGVFRLPNGFVAAIIGVVLKIAQSRNAPPEITSDLRDAYVAMKNGPPLSESLRSMILKSDPKLMADFALNALRGDPPLEEVDPW